MKNATAIEELRWKKFPIGSDGFVCLVDVMGDDSSITQAARVSYGKDLRDEQGKEQDDRTLIRYLMRHRHSTPFEMAEVKPLCGIVTQRHLKWPRLSCSFVFRWIAGDSGSDIGRRTSMSTRLATRRQSILVRRQSLLIGDGRRRTTSRGPAVI
jgi:hypothetical protein